MFDPQKPDWYTEATLLLDGNLLRAGTLIQCARRWGLLEKEEREMAQIRMGSGVDLFVLSADEIATLLGQPGFRDA
jgi:hypothetical protein